MPRRSVFLLAVPALAVGVALGPAAAALAGTTGATAQATGANEVGQPGDPAATASATFSFDTSANQLCYTVSATSLQAVAMHVHKGLVGADGPVVVPLDPTKIGAGKTCTTVAATLLSDIASNPASYYFNAHSKAYPAGAVRGQLVASATSAVAAPTAVSAGSGGQSQDSSSTLPLVLVLVGGAAIGTASWRLARR